MLEVSRASATRGGLGRAARMVVEKNYSRGRMVNAYEELYASFLGIPYAQLKSER
jgi:glycosyltransferase involved in cell wall biosynthesis